MTLFHSNEISCTCVCVYTMNIKRSKDCFDYIQISSCFVDYLYLPVAASSSFYQILSVLGFTAFELWCCVKRYICIYELYV